VTIGDYSLSKYHTIPKKINYFSCLFGGTFAKESGPLGVTEISTAC